MTRKRRAALKCGSRRTLSAERGGLSARRTCVFIRAPRGGRNHRGENILRINPNAVRINQNILCITRGYAKDKSCYVKDKSGQAKDK